MGISIPPESRDNWPLIRDVLAKKADERWVSSEVQGIRNRLGEIIQVLEYVRGEVIKPHKCYMESDMVELKAWRSQVTSFKIVVMLAVVMAVIGGASYLFLIDGTVRNSVENVVEIKEDLKELRADYTKFREEVKVIVEAKDSERSQEFEELRFLIENSIHDRRRKK